MPTDDPVADAEAFRAKQEAEYGEYVAVEAVNIGGARAFNPGDPVPKGHVDSGVVTKDQVARRSTKAAQAVTGQES
jgi:hypothetical protein